MTESPRHASHGPPPFNKGGLIGGAKKAPLLKGAGSGETADWGILSTEYSP